MSQPMQTYALYSTDLTVMLFQWNCSASIQITCGMLLQFNNILLEGVSAVDMSGDSTGLYDTFSFS